MARVLNPKRRRYGTRLGTRCDLAPGHPLHAYLNAWSEWFLAAGFSETTVYTHSGHITQFIVWCDDRGVNQPGEINRPMLERYQRSVYQYRKSNGAPLSNSVQRGRLIALKTWFRWMVRQNILLHNPAADLEMPKKNRSLPKTILSVAQVEDILNQADTCTSMGIRNRAMMEVFYSTGIRRVELIRLKQYDLDLERGTLMVRQGKGSKDRLLPIGERACKWVDKYLLEVRHEIVSGYDDQTLFLNDFGQPMKPTFLNDLIRRHIEAVGITTPGACHLFRHAMATHMLDNGADIRFIQAMLGHSKLETTEVYTFVSLTKLKEIHNATHPARIARHKATATAATGEDAQTLLDLLDEDDD